jgi:hypothetical protein
MLGLDIKVSVSVVDLDVVVRVKRETVSKKDDEGFGYVKCSTCLMVEGLKDVYLY